MNFASKKALQGSGVVLLGVGLALPGCAQILGLGDFREGGSGGGGTGGTGTGDTTSSTTDTSSSSTTTTGAGGCSAEQVECSGTCTTLAEDNLNCGMCGKVCDAQTPSAATCANAKCTACAPPRADCDGLGANVCEADLTSDRKNCGACGHACAGTCSSSRCQPVTLASDVPNPYGVTAVDGHVFWGDGTKAITQALSDGSNATTLPITGDFAVNKTHVYSIEQDGVWRTAISGGAAELFVNGQDGSDLAVDAKYLYVSWLHDKNAGFNSDFLFYDLDTKTPTTLATDTPNVSLLLPGDGLIFWLQSGGFYKTSLVPGSNHTLVGATQFLPQSLLNADATDLYWVESGVVTIPIFGANPNTDVKVIPSTNNAFGLANDADSLYWADGIDQLIRKTPKNGGATTTLASAQLKVNSIAVDDTFVYWTTSGPSGAVVKVEKNP